MCPSNPPSPTSLPAEYPHHLPDGWMGAMERPTSSATTADAGRDTIKTLRPRVLLPGLGNSWAIALYYESTPLARGTGLPMASLDE